MLDSATRARIALLLLLCSLAVCSAAIYSAPNRLTLAVHSSEAMSLDPSATLESLNDVYVSQQLAEMQHRPLTSADLQRLWKYLDETHWPAAASALRLIELNQYPQAATARMRLLKRVAAVIKAGPVAVPSQQEWGECLHVAQEILDQYQASSDVTGSERTTHQIRIVPGASSHARREVLRLFGDLATHAQDSNVRAHALTLLAREPSDNLQLSDVEQAAIAALEDPSEQVCLTALEIVAQNRWQSAAPSVIRLVSSARPELRKRAAQVQRFLGSTQQPLEYGACVMRAAGQIADQFQRIGIDCNDSLQIMAGERVPIGADQLNQMAEAFLDRTADPATRDRDLLGVLLLVAAARAEQRKLTLRLWESEVARTDADAELFELALQAVARSQLLSALCSLQRGDQALARVSMSSVARLEPYARPHSPLQAYVRHARTLSSAIWQQSTGAAIDSAERGQVDVPDAVTQVIARVFDQLDLGRPEHMKEAQRRVDQWCKLDPGTPIRSHADLRRPLAN